MTEAYRCPSCGRWFFDKTWTKCERCWRLGLYGVILMRTQRFDVLDAIASLMIDGARQRQRARRDLNEAINEAIGDGQREMRAAFEEGIYEERNRRN